MTPALITLRWLAGATETAGANVSVHRRWSASPKLVPSTLVLQNSKQFRFRDGAVLVRIRGGEQLQNHFHGRSTTTIHSAGPSRWLGNKQTWQTERACDDNGLEYSNHVSTSEARKEKTDHERAGQSIQRSFARRPVRIEKGTKSFGNARCPKKNVVCSGDIRKETPTSGQCAIQHDKGTRFFVSIAEKGGFSKTPGIRWCFLENGARVEVSHTDIGDASCFKTTIRSLFFERTYAMNLSGLSSAVSSQTPSTQSNRPGPPPPNEEQLSSALEAVGVDDTTATKVLAQIDDALAELNSESSVGNDPQAFRSAVEEVLDANGIDSAEVEQALRANGPAGAGGVEGARGPGRGGRPQGPPPPPPEDETTTSSLESALLSAGVDESSTDELVSQIIDSLEELAAEADGNASTDQIRAALTGVLEENGVDADAFAQAIASDLNEAGLVIDEYA
jgi:hypothetical protein